MVGEGWDCCMSSKMVTTTCCQSRVWSKLAWLLVCFLLFTPRLSEFWLIGAIHSISTLPMSQCKYYEWFCNVEIWIHHPRPSPHPSFWVGGGDKIGSSTLHFTPRWCMLGLIQGYHSISMLPTSHYKYTTSHFKYNEWLEKVEIAAWALKWSPQRVFSHGWGQSWLGSSSAFHTKIEWVWTDWGN